MEYGFVLRVKKIPCLSLLCFLAAAISGCASYQGEPRRVYPVEEQIQFVKKTFGYPDFNAYIALPPANRKAYRNEYVLAQIYAIDVNYGVYEADLTREMQSVGFASTVANIGLTTVATQISSTATKNILTATASALTGAKAAYDKDILIARTIQIIQSQMRASRAKVASKIYSNLSRSSDEYPLMMAWIDLQAYFKAGTLTDGLVEAGQTIGADAIAAAEMRDYTVIQARPASDPEVVTLRGFLYPNGTLDAARVGYLDALLVNNRHQAATYIIQNDPQYAGIIAKLFQCMSAYGTAGQCKAGSIMVP